MNLVNKYIDINLLYCLVTSKLNHRYLILISLMSIMTEYFVH